MARVFWDTNLFIYLFEKNAAWSPRVIELRRRMLARGDELLTSYLTVGEVITKPKQLNNAMLERSYLKFFSGGSVELVGFSGLWQRWASCHPLADPDGADQMVTDYATSVDGREWTWHGTALNGRPGYWDYRDRVVPPAPAS